MLDEMIPLVLAEAVEDFPVETDTVEDLTVVAEEEAEEEELMAPVLPDEVEAEEVLTEEED